jgi:hypothetical protein
MLVQWKRRVWAWRILASPAAQMTLEQVKARYRQPAPAAQDK